MSGVVKSGELVGMLAPKYILKVDEFLKRNKQTFVHFIFSGSGKTTLLNILMGRNLKNLKRETGEVHVNGHDVEGSITYISGVIFYQSFPRKFYQFLF